MANAPSVSTYTNDPATVLLDRVRLETGDVDCSAALLTDKEINLYITEEPNILRAAAKAALAIAAKLARKIDFSHGTISKSASQQYTHYRDLAAELARKANTLDVGFEVLGITKADKETADQDDAAVQPNIRIGQHDNPRSGPTPASNPNESNVV